MEEDDDVGSLSLPSSASLGLHPRFRLRPDPLLDAAGGVFGLLLGATGDVVGLVGGLLGLSGGAVGVFGPLADVLGVFG